MSKQVFYFWFGFGSWTKLNIRSQTQKGSRLMGDYPQSLIDFFVVFISKAKDREFIYEPLTQPFTFDFNLRMFVCEFPTGLVYHSGTLKQETN